MEHPEGEIYLIPQLNAKQGEYQPPTELRLVAAGDFYSRDGRFYRNPHPKKIIAAFNREKIQLAIDFDHSMAQQGGGPASGWIKKLAERHGEIWAVELEWLSTALYALESKEYRYYSPHYHVDPETREIVKLDVVSLVNRPALSVSALNHYQSQTEDQMDLKDELNAALKRTLELELAKAAAETKVSELSVELNSLKAEDEKRKAELKGYRDKEANTQSKALKDEVNACLDALIAQGKLLPAHKAHHAQTIRSKEELNSFAGLYKDAAPMLPTKRDPVNQPKLDEELNSLELDAEDLAIAKELGLASEDFKGDK